MLNPKPELLNPKPPQGRVLGKELGIRVAGIKLCVCGFSVGRGGGGGKLLSSTSART